MAYDEQRWRYAAATLGLTVHDHVGLYDAKACFDRLARARGAPFAGGKSQASELWMSGRTPVPAMQRDVEIIVLPHTVSSTSTAASGEVNHHSHHYTHVIARIDPPLLLGLELHLHRPIELFGRLPTIPTGDPPFDDAFALTAAMPALAARLFTRMTAPPNDLIDHLFAIRGLGTISVSDSCVDVQTSFTDDVSTLAPRIASAAALAAYIGARRGPLPRDAEEHTRLSAWQACAEAERLELDGSRFAMVGTVAGMRTRLAVETEHSDTFTSLHVAPLQSLGLGLRLSKQGALQFIAGIFGSQDVRVGDEAFDKAFVVKAKDEARVKSLFAASPPARQALLELLQWCPDLVLDDDGLFVRWRGVADAATLHRALLLVKALSGVLAPAHGGAQPYRSDARRS